LSHELLKPEIAMSFTKTTFVVALLALMTGCGSVGMVTGSTRLAGGGGATGVALTQAPAMNSPGNVDRPVERSADTGSKSTPREPVTFRMENCPRCN